MRVKKPKIKEPEDLEIELGTRDQRMWTEVKDGIEAEIKRGKKELKINEAFLKLAEEKIAAEKAEHHLTTGPG